MARFAANLSMMFTEAEFPVRFERAAEAGFKAVEFLFPYDYSPGEVAGWLRENGLAAALFNMPSGDWEAGERGMAAAEGALETYKANLSAAADRLAREGLDLLIEPINTRDMPGYFLNRTGDAIGIIEAVGKPNLKLQFDIYHRQIMDGDVVKALERSIAHIGHIQIAGIPDRHEPSEGELNYPYVIERLDALGYAGWIGCEYHPKGKTEDGLGWLKG